MKLIAIFLYTLFSQSTVGNTVLPISNSSGFEITFPFITAYYYPGDSVNSLSADGGFGIVYNKSGQLGLGIYLPFSADIKNSKDSTETIYNLNDALLSAKFGFPFTQNSNMGLTMLMGIPLSPLTGVDRAGYWRELSAQNIYTGFLTSLDIWSGNIHFLPQIGFLSEKNGEFSQQILYDLYIAFLKNNNALYIGFNGKGFSSQPYNEFGDAVKSLTAGLELSSDFNTSLGMNFSYVLGSPGPGDKLSDIPYPIKYRAGLYVKFQYMSARFKRIYRRKKEKAKPFVFIKRFYRLKGNVYEKGTSKPVMANISVYKDNHMLKTLTCDTLGIFHLDSIKRGLYTIKAYAKDFLPFSDSIRVNSMQNTLSIPLKKRPVSDSGTLLIKIKDARTGLGLKGASIFILDMRKNFNSDSTGTAYLKLKNGTYLIQITKSGYEKITRPVAITREKTTTLSIKLTKKL